MQRDNRSKVSIRERIAGAPISWGVCEVAGWGHQLKPDRVLSEMASLGLAASEFGPDGFLPADPAAKAAALSAHGLRAVGGFLPILLHDPGHDPLPAVDRFIDGCLVSGAEVMVLAAFTGVEGYDARPVLDDLGWKTLLANLDRVKELADDRGITACLHPHFGTMVERSDEVERVMHGSTVDLCVDTGHLAVGGADPVAITTTYAQRVKHVHLKDVDMQMARQVSSGQLPFGAAVERGMFRPLGDGDLDIATLVHTLESSGYSGWYVLEQDVMLPRAPLGHGPLGDVGRSLAYLGGVGQ